MASLSAKLALLRLAGWLIGRIDRLPAKRKGAATGSAAPGPRQPPAAAVAQRRDSSRRIAQPPAAAAKFIINTDQAEDKALTAQILRKRLRDPRSLRQAIVINEILSKPLALRRHGRR